LIIAEHSLRNDKRTIHYTENMPEGVVVVTRKNGEKLKLTSMYDNEVLIRDVLPKGPVEEFRKELGKIPRR